MPGASTLIKTNPFIKTPTKNNSRALVSLPPRSLYDCRQTILKLTELFCPFRASFPPVFVARTMLSQEISLLYKVCFFFSFAFPCVLRLLVKVCYLHASFNATFALFLIEKTISTVKSIKIWSRLPNTKTLCKLIKIFNWCVWSFRQICALCGVEGMFAVFVALFDRFSTLASRMLVSIRSARKTTKRNIGFQS